MVDADSIKRASELVNQVLYAKGFFEKGSGSNDKLLFKTIDEQDLGTEEEVYENDKLSINTIYALIQNYERANQEKSILIDQLNDKKEIISHYEASSRELNSKNDQLVRVNHKQQNEIESLKQQLKYAKQNTVIQERNFIREKQLNGSLRTKYEIDIKRKTILINQLQDKLLKRHKKFQNVIEGNNASFTIEATNNSNTEMDQELEKMMVNLSNLITNLTLQNDQNIKFINYLTSYLHILNDFLLRKLRYEDQDGSGNTVALPPTPKFYFENFSKIQDSNPNQSDSDIDTGANNSDDIISSKISHIINYEKIQSVAFINLDKFYELIINDSIYNMNNSNSSSQFFGGNEKVKTLEAQVDELNKNLNIAIETNEKWKRKFHELEQNK